MQGTGTCCPPQGKVATFTLLSVFFEPREKRRLRKEDSENTGKNKR